MWVEEVMVGVCLLYAGSGGGGGNAGVVMTGVRQKSVL